jgi:hypothetical protein
MTPPALLLLLSPKTTTATTIALILKIIALAAPSAAVEGEGISDGPFHLRVAVDIAAAAACGGGLVVVVVPRPLQVLRVPQCHLPHVTVQQQVGVHGGCRLGRCCGCC